MIGRNKRGVRRASMRVRLAVAAALLVGGGAAGVVAVAASHGSATTAQSAGFTTAMGSHQKLSETKALSSAMNGWNQSPGRSLSTLAEMTPMRSFNMTPFHTHMLALQRGTVLAAGRNEFVIKSTNRTLELWHVSHGTKFLNVGGSMTGMAAMTGGTMAAGGQMDAKVKSVTKGDLVFIFGERVHGQLVAQLVLFAAPMKAPAPVVTPSATPSMTTSPGMVAAPNMTATPGTMVTPTAPATITGTHS
jgi:hypothetical protein